MKKIKKIIRYFYYLCLVFLATIAILVAISAFDFKNGFKLYTVQSGSMSPTLKVGSLVVVKPQTTYFKDNIITFQTQDYTTTHRLIDIQNGQFITKGDANEEADQEPVHQEDILGKVIFHLPLLGQPIAFAKTQTGFILLIVIPATIIIYSEILTIKQEIQTIKKKRKSKSKK